MVGLSSSFDVFRKSLSQFVFNIYLMTDYCKVEVVVPLNHEINYLKLYINFMKIDNYKIYIIM